MRPPPTRQTNLRTSLKQGRQDSQNDVYSLLNRPEGLPSTPVTYLARIRFASTCFIPVAPEASADPGTDATVELNASQALKDAAHHPSRVHLDSEFPVKVRKHGCGSTCPGFPTKSRRFLTAAGNGRPHMARGHSLPDHPATGWPPQSIHQK